MQKKTSFLNKGEGRVRERRCADHIFIQIYFRMHHFVAKFSNFLRRQGGIDRPNQNPADALTDGVNLSVNKSKLV